MSDLNENPSASNENGDKPEVKRDSRGRVVSGVLNTKGGRVNEHYLYRKAMGKALREAITPNDLVAVVSAMAAKALEGNTTAAQLLLSYGIGRPTERPDGVDLELDLPVPRKAEDLPQFLIDVTAA